ncbi:hypothetical protein V6N12_063708 [Hibiscus sabdariffa]|uniref:Thymidine kinase n=1 Tax=Hibiscus sabdariffa TaxID=183260 RepID=A0ABR2FCG8_9ROSI
MLSPTRPIPSIPTPQSHAETTQSSSLCGEIHVIVGPMFAGKTTTLLRRIQAESNNGRIVAVIKSSKDTRYGLDSIVTHDGMKLPCWALANLSLFRQKIGTDAMISLMSSASMKLNSLKTFMTSAVRLLIMMAKQL